MRGDLLGNWFEVERVALKALKREREPPERVGGIALHLGELDAGILEEWRSALEEGRRSWRDAPSGSIA